MEANSYNSDDAGPMLCGIETVDIAMGSQAYLCMVRCSLGVYCLRVAEMIGLPIISGAMINAKLR